MKRAYLHLVALLLLAMITSCAKDWGSITTDEEQDASSQVVLRIKTPSGFSSGASTRSLTLEDERKIENIWVLAFNAEGNLTEMRKGENLTDVDATTRSFTATLQRSKNAADTYNLMVLANAEEIIVNQIGTDIEKIQDKSYTAITALLYETIGGKMYASGGTIPMWGESGSLEIKLGLNNNISLSLLRSVARIDIGVGSPLQDTDGTYKWTGKDSKNNQIPFELKEVYVVKASDRYAVVPDMANITDKKAIAPTVPIDATPFTIEQSIANFKYADTDITPSIGEFGSYTTQSIYIPEADLKLGENAKSGDANHENRMAIIVGGDYNNSGRTTYYRLDLAKSGEILDALRNHLYQFNISKVSGYGYADVETAYRSLSMNMQVDILDWDESEMEDVIFDGQNYFSISKSKVEFSPMGKESETVTIKTNVKSLEMWEERDGGEHLEMKLGGTTTYTNADMGYVYTLTTVTSGSVYNLKVEAIKHNVSNTVPNRLDKWKIKANRLNAKFEVDQQYTVLYVSYVNGQSQNLYPEGTLANTISIDIMALKPVTIKAEENGAEATWIDLGDVSGLTTGEDGLYQARLEVKVNPFVYAQNVSNIRTGTITVIPQDETPRVFTINQESPVFKFAKSNEVVTRKSGITYHTYVDIITNLPETDFQIADVDPTVGADAWRIIRKENLYLVDKTNPRSRRFDVDVDMETKLPLNADAFEKSFTATIDPKYGAVAQPIIKFEVLQGSSHFDWFWYDAIVPPVVVPYAFPKEDNAMKYLFPWQTQSVVFRFNSNNGLEHDTSNSGNKLRQGKLEKLSDIPGEDGNDYTITPYRFTFNKANNNNPDYYDLYFKSTLGTALSKNITMGLGVQMWKRNPASATIGVSYKGYAEATPYVLNVTSNVEWDATVTSGDASFIKVRPNTTATWVTPPMHSDDRVTVPEVIEAYNAETNLVKTNAMGVAITPYNTLNATPATREVKLLFVNASYNAGGSGGGIVIADPVLTLTQYASTLEYVSGAPTTTVPYYGGPHTVKVNTNLQSWGVRIYLGNDNSGVKLAEKAFGTTTVISDKAPTERTLTIDVPRYNSTVDRTISFYLYHTEADVATKEIKLTTQIQTWVDYVEINGLIWKQGSLIASSATTCTIGAPWDTGLYFPFGSLIGYKSGNRKYNGTGEGISEPMEWQGHWGGGASFNFLTDAMVWPTIMIGYPNAWFSGSRQNQWFFGTREAPYNKAGENIRNFPGYVAGNLANKGIGDPCTYYLGAAWRQPTDLELKAVYDAGWSGVGYKTFNGSPGIYIGPNATNQNLATSSFFPAAGVINADGLGIANPGLIGYYATCSVSPNGAAASMRFESDKVVIPNNSWRENAFSVRCVRNK